MHYFKYALFLLNFIFLELTFAQTNLQFLSKNEASKSLATFDEFIARLSKFDMAARMKTDRIIGKAKFLEYISSSTLNWNKLDIIKVTTAFDSINIQLQKLKIKLPNKIEIILTNGKDEGNVVYTRGNAIIFQQDKLYPNIELKRLIAHEIFHIYTRNNPLAKDILYKIIGFYPVKEQEFPYNLKNHKITNPDAPKNDYAIRIKYNNELLWVYPIIFSTTDTYDTSKGGEFFDYLQFKLLALDGQKIYISKSNINQRILDITQVADYFKQVGRNTNYIIHPEEILADNFALMILGIKDIPSPEIINKMQNIFYKFSLKN